MRTTSSWWRRAITFKLQTGASSEAGKKAGKDGKKDFAYDPEVTEHRPVKREFCGGPNVWETQDQILGGSSAHRLGHTPAPRPQDPLGGQVAVSRQRG